MKFDVYGRFRLEVLRESEVWAAYRIGTGTRARDNSIVIPGHLAAHEIAGYLDDVFHELSGPGQGVRLLP